MESDISKIEKELEEARRDLAQTLRQVNEKVEAVGAQLRPESQIRRHAGVAAGIAAAVGFAFAYAPTRLKILGGLAAGAIVGLSVELENSAYRQLRTSELSISKNDSALKASDTQRVARQQNGDGETAVP